MNRRFTVVNTTMLTYMKGKLLLVSTTKNTHKQAIKTAHALYYGTHRDEQIAASCAWNARNAKSVLKHAQ